MLVTAQSSQPTADDTIPIGHVGRNIEGKSMTGDAVGIHFHPDGGDLGLVDPNTGETGNRLSSDPKLLQGKDKHLLKLAQVRNVISLREGCQHHAEGDAPSQWHSRG